MGKRTFQTDVVKQKIDHLLTSGVTSKIVLYDKLERETGLDRPTIRRIARKYKTEIENKIKVMTNKTLFENEKEKVPYWWVPLVIREKWKGITKVDFDQLKCNICNRHVGYLKGYVDGDVVCTTCTAKFPKKGKKE